MPLLPIRLRSTWPVALLAAAVLVGSARTALTAQGPGQDSANRRDSLPAAEIVEAKGDHRRDRGSRQAETGVAGEDRRAAAGCDPA
jgi:hypothetical protein